MYISIDIGGTNTRVASSQNLKDIIATETFSSQKNLDDEKTMLSQTIRKLLGGEKLSAIAIGVAGIVDREACYIQQSPNYKAIDQTSIKDLVGENNFAKLYCGNDSEIACLGEAVLGAGAKFKSVGYLSLGTGVGGALIENGRISTPPKLFEPGHQIVDVSSSMVDGFGIKGSLETFISGESFKKRYNVQPHMCKDEKIWFEYGRNVGLGVHNMAMLWSPECIVIGGGMSKYFDNFISGVNDFLSGDNFIKLPKILKAEFGQGSGIVGGFVLISQATGYSF